MKMPVLREVSQRQAERDVALLLVDGDDAHLRAGEPGKRRRQATARTNGAS